MGFTLRVITCTICMLLANLSIIMLRVARELLGARRAQDLEHDDTHTEEAFPRPVAAVAASAAISVACAKVGKDSVA